MKIYFVLIIILFFTAGCLANNNTNVPPTIDKPTACTLEAKVCPDGSVVARSGPNCEFAPCPNLLEKQVVSSWQRIVAEDIPNTHSAFSFSASIPAGWQVEAAPLIEGINIFDPEGNGGNNLEKSQIFIRHFKANTFLTLSTVKIYTQTETEINDRPTVVYDIEKNSDVANFKNQPLWRSQRHTVTDIRVSDSNPSIFYVIAKQPGLSQEIFDQFLNSLNANNKISAINFPIKEFAKRITKKPFGIYITPETSPVQPERFRGFHTGVDVEYRDTVGPVPVLAITSGEVIFSNWVSGYGGVVAINHSINKQDYLVIYGHLAPDSLPKKIV